MSRSDALKWNVKTGRTGLKPVLPVFWGDIMKIKQSVKSSQSSFLPVLIAIILMLVSCACRNKQDSIPLSSGDRKSVKIEIIKLVPLGSSMQIVKEIMGKEGFECNMLTQTEFSEYGDDTNGNPISIQKNIDFLLCSKTVKPSLLYQVTWQIAFVSKGDVLSDVLVRQIHSSL